jgi:hypothetical protein
MNYYDVGCSKFCLESHMNPDEKSFAWADRFTKLFLVSCLCLTVIMSCHSKYKTNFSGATYVKKPPSPPRGYTPWGPQCPARVWTCAKQTHDFRSLCGPVILKIDWYMWILSLQLPIRVLFMSNKKNGSGQTK